MELTELTNSFNGQLSAGLSGKGDTGLTESEKMALVPLNMVETCVTDLTELSDWALCIGMEPTCRTLTALAHAAHQAIKVGVNGKPYDSLGNLDQCLGLEVCPAFAVVFLGLVGYFQADPVKVTQPGKCRPVYAYKGISVTQPAEDHICEFDTVDPFYGVNGPIVPAYDMPAQGTKDMSKEEMAACMKVAVDAMLDPADHWLKSYCQTKLATDIVTAIIATKFNWFTTNHPVGQGYATKYICKVMNNTYSWTRNMDTGITEGAKNTLWKVGHWASTHLCLRILGMRSGVRVCVHPAASPLDTVVLSADYKVRCDSAPAGLAKIALVHATMTLFRNNNM